jgi:hypothetical protein
MSDATHFETALSDAGAGTRSGRFSALLAALASRAPVAADAPGPGPGPEADMPGHERDDRGGAPWRGPGVNPHLGFAAAVVSLMSRD